MNYFNKANTLANSTIALAHAHIQEEFRVGSYTVQVKSRLAEGGFGVVDLVVDTHSKKEHVLKRCNIDREESFSVATKEINMLQRYRGPNVVALLDTTIVQKNRSSREALLLLEFCPGGHLLSRLLERGESYLPVDAIYRMFGQICVAISALHSSRPVIVHRDIKLENVLFGEDGRIRLCDFGSCTESPVYIRNAEERTAAEEHISKETTQMYRAPEMVDLYMRSSLTEKTDIWALGCLLYAMSFLVHPFQDGSTLSILNARVSFPANSPYSEDLHALILRMLDIDPECRPTIAETIDSVRSLADGSSLPLMNLSADALKCRTDRIEANKVRESKAKSKAKTAAPLGPKKAIAVNTNSAAARRLAAMRGGQHPISEGLPGGASEVPFVLATDETYFDPFGSSSAPFDPFGSSSVPFDPFGSAVGSAPVAADLVGSEPARTTPVTFFDAFSDSSVPDQLFSVTEGFAASNRSEDVSFDPFSVQVADGFESTACRSPTPPSRHFSMFSSNSRNPSIINSSDDFFAPSSSSTSINNSQNQEWSSIDADAFGYNDGDRGATTTTSSSSKAVYSEVDFFNLDNEPQSSSISIKKPMPMRPPKPSNNSTVPETTVSVEASRSAASRLFVEAAPYADPEGAGSIRSPSKPSKPTKPKKLSDEQSPALIDFDTDSSIHYNVESSIAYATPSRAVPPKPSKRESISLIDFDYSATISEFPKADTTATKGTNAHRHVNPFEGDLLEMPVAVAPLPSPSINSKHSSASLQADVLSLYDLPMSPPPIPTQAPPGIKPAKPSVIRPQYAATSSMNSPAIDMLFGASYTYPSAASPRPALQPYPSQQLQPSSPRYPTTPSTQRGGPMSSNSYDPFSSIQQSFGKQ